jgi:condensation enzyme
VISESPDVQEADVGRPPLSSNQRLWCAYDPTAAFGPRFIITRSLRVKGEVNTSALQEALDDVVARHEILRTVVVRDAEPPYQEIHRPSPVPLRVRAFPNVTDQSRDAYAWELLLEAEQSSVDVQEVPLLWADLSAFDDHDSVLTVVTHHTAADGWSMSLILRDLAACYTARAAGQVPALPPIRQYREFTAWEQSIAASPMADEARAYWRQKLRGARFFALPVDHLLAEPLSTPYNSHHFSVDAEVMTAVSATAKSAHATPFMVLLAAIDVLAYEIGGTTDPVIRNITAGRGEREFQDTVGVTLHFAPLRTDISQCGSFREVVESVRDTCIEASSREISLDIIAQEAPELNKSAEDPRLTIFLLGYYRQTSADAEINIADGARLVRAPELQPKDHISPHLADGAVWTMHLLRSGELKCRIEFNSGKFDRDTIANFAQAYRRILARATAEPERNWQTL